LDENVALQRKRIVVLAAVLAVAGLILLVRLASWQLLPHAEIDYYAGKGQASSISATRGSIYDATGHALVASSVYYTLGVSPKLLTNKNKQAYAVLLSEAFGRSPEHAVTPEAMFDLLSEDATYVVLGKDLPAQVGQSIEELERTGQIVMDAFKMELTPSRVYPDGGLAAHVLGWLRLQTHDEDTNPAAGFYGLEERYDSELRGVDGTWQRISDKYGKPVLAQLEGYAPARDGADLTLTLDRNIQFEAERILRESNSEFKAGSATIVVLDPTSGALLAMANLPGFLPGDRSADRTTEVYVNRAISSLYDPGSVFTPLTLALALQTRVIRSTDSYDDRGEMAIGNRLILNEDRDPHGQTSMTQLVARSYNVGAAHLAVLLGPTRFYEGMRNFGFGSKTEIDLQHEAAGIMWVPTDSGWNMSYLGMNALGEWISATPLQVATAYAAIANGGVLMRPYVVARMSDETGVTDTRPIAIRRVLSTEVADEVSNMLVEAVNMGMEDAMVGGYRLAGKFGTVSMPDREGTPNQYNMVSYVGYGPVPNPRFVILVKFEQPQEIMWERQSAEPVFARMAEYLLDYYGIPPTGQ